jgi:DNA-binding MarR family transcriptional regulator
MGPRKKTNPGEEPFLKVLRPLVEATFAFLRRNDRNIRSLGLTPSQFDVIATLGDTPGMSCGEISVKTLVTKGTLTGVLDRLEAKGIIERVRSKNDRRSTIIRLTIKGDRIYRKVFPAQMAFLKPYYERALSAGQMNELRSMLMSLKASFENS